LDSGVLSKWFWWLCGVGLVLRLGGIVFNGQHDVAEFVLQWGASVRTVGLVQGLTVNYGVFSFAVFGVDAYFGEMIPRFWWLPFKLTLIAFEVALFAALVRFAPVNARSLVLAAYWLNPWFIVHGGYQGFWEAPHLLFGVLACLAVRRWAGSPAAWVTCGVLLLVSAEFKPQGLLHLAGPVGFFLLVLALQSRRPALVWFGLGFGAAGALISIAIFLAGGSVFAALRNMMSSFGFLPVVSAGNLGLWRFVSFAIMQVHGLPGEVHQLQLSEAATTALSLVAAALCLGLLTAFAMRLARQVEAGRPIWIDAYLMMAFGALTLSQLGLRAHLNHTYTAMVILIPLLPVHRRLRLAWIAGVAVQGFAHLTKYGIGWPSLLPTDAWLAEHAPHGSIAAGVRALPALAEPDAILQFNMHANRMLEALATHQQVSVIGFAMVPITVVILMALFELAARRNPFQDVTEETV
jgi:hypothetical protein